ncbi:uncharacterized protein LOC126926794 isoform X1 [Bombus affinis]|uniref:uncharacterized protein LOC126926794 isoform X1 n=1 Tax=Bombus affinis TaxID=309941 RepID=UPI0021B830E4|nr:uncharacterized protein LOC126926794 isoform X1 [Bombus affinis]
MKWITVTGDLKGISSNWPGKTTEQKGSRSKSFRSNSFDVSTLHGAKSKLSGSSKAAISTFMAPSNWFTKRHQPMSKKPEDLVTASLSLKFDKSKVVKAVKETLGKKSPNSEVKHKVVWDNTSGTKVDAQVFGSAIEKMLTAQKGNDTGASGSSGKPSVSPNKPMSGKVTNWFSNTKNQNRNQTESSEPSLCSSLKDLFKK